MKIRSFLNSSSPGLFMIRAGAFKIRAMEKAIFEEGQHVITPAGAGQIIHKSSGGKWTVDTGGMWEDYPQDEIVSAILLSPEPANNWDFHAAPASETLAMMPLYPEASQEEWRCGDMENRCNCSGPGECGYIYVDDAINRL